MAKQVAQKQRYLWGFKLNIRWSQYNQKSPISKQTLKNPNTKFQFKKEQVKMFFRFLKRSIIEAI